MMKTILFYTLLAAGITGACTSTGSKEKATAIKDTTAKTITPDEALVTLTKEQAANAGIVTGIPSRKEMFSLLKVNGTLDVPPQNIVSVSVPLGGYLKKTTLLPGIKVSKGSILAIMEDQQYIQLQQDYLTARSRLQYASDDYTRQKGLNETKAVSDKIYQQAKAEYETQKIQASALAEKLRLIGINPATLSEATISRTITITSPINGYVTKVNVNTGKYISPTDILFELVNPDDLHLSLTVFENDAAHLFNGQKLTCYTNSQPGKKYPASIHYITPAIGEDRATEVHCHISQYGKELMPGMFMNAEIELHNAQVNAVPEEAVVTWQSKQYIFAEEAPFSYRLSPVETGTSHNGFIEIKSTLPTGNIIIKNAYTALMKMKNSE